MEVQESWAYTEVLVFRLDILIGEEKLSTEDHTET